MLPLSRLLQQLQDSDSDSSDSDSDSSSDDGAGLIHLLALSAAARAASVAASAVVSDDADDAVTRALAGLVVLEGLRKAISGDDGSIREGDMVRLKADESTVKAQQTVHGGWNPDMAKDLGRVGSVMLTHPNGDPVVHFGKKTWRLNPECCSKITADMKAQMFKFGDRVYVEFSNSIAERMQKAHGGWNSLMGSDLLKVGQVMGVDDDGDVHVQFATRCWRVNAAACKLLATESGADLKVGDKVFLDNDVDLGVLKDMQEGHGGWNAKIAADVGHIGEVVAIDKDGDLQVKFGKNKWFLSPHVCTKVTKTVRPAKAVNQRVIMEMEPAEFLKLQIGHGGIDTAMLTDLGKVGKVLSILPDKDLMVQFPPNVWSLNPAICTLLSENPKPSIEVGDQVFIALDAETVKMLQEEHGGFTDAMYRLLGQMGKVCKVMSDGDIFVLYGILPLRLSPAIVSCFIPRGYDVDDAHVTMSTYTVGDLVTVDSSLGVEQIAKLQGGHGGWNDRMLTLLGKVGIVQKVDTDGDLRVCYGQILACLNPAVCSKVQTDGVETNDSQSVKTPPTTRSAEVINDATSKATVPETATANTSADGNDSMMCAVCKKRSIAIVFGCGHGSCEPCAKSMKDCFDCKAQITMRTNLIF